MYNRSYLFVPYLVSTITTVIDDTLESYILKITVDNLQEIGYNKYIKDEGIDWYENGSTKIIGILC